MKKFTLLSGIAALATIGGVFAAWNFSGAKTELTNDSQVTVSVESTIVDAGVYGTAAVSGTMALKFDHNAEHDRPVLTNGGKAQTITCTYTTGAGDVDGWEYTAAASVAVSGHTDCSDYFTYTPYVGEPTTLKADSTTISISDSDITSLFVGIENSIKTRAALDAFKTAVGDLAITITFTITRAAA